MITRRGFLRSAIMTPVTAKSLDKHFASDSARDSMVTIKPYQWQGPYADYRTRNRAQHDWRLCVDARASWFSPCERLILRTSEIIGHETGFLYDDHFPPSEPEGRGKNYHHIPFEWKVVTPNHELFADCAVPKVGGFSIRLTTRDDFIDIDLAVRNDMPQPMRDTDWAFCTVAFESPSIADSEDDRTNLFDGQRLRTLGNLAGRDMTLYKVAGAHGFIPVGHRAISVGPVLAQASVVIVEALDGNHSVALGFAQADHIYGDSKGNKCFHADPYFGQSIATGKESKLRGRLYLIKGNPSDAFRRYQLDFERAYRATLKGVNNAKT